MIARALWVGVLVAALCGAARAQETGDRELAKSRFDTGQALYQRGEYADALAEFEAARREVKAPAFDYNIGMCLEHLNRPHEAAEAFERYLAGKPDDPDAASLREKIARLRATPEKPATPEPAPRPAPSSPPAPVAPAPVMASPAPAATSVSKVRRVRTRAAIAMTVVGGALLAGGAAAGGVALNRRSDYDSTCNNGHCDQTIYDHAHEAALACDVLLSFGAAAAVTAVVLFATRPKERRVSLAPLVGPSTAGVVLGASF